MKTHGHVPWELMHTETYPRVMTLKQVFGQNPHLDDGAYNKNEENTGLHSIRPSWISGWQCWFSFFAKICFIDFIYVHAGFL